jgi:HAD superfamily hydrolase (TIGR01458 family)
MTEQKKILKNNCKGILLDLEGVLYEGNKLLEGSIEIINNLLKLGINIRLLTNTTTLSRRLIFEKLLKFQLPLIEKNIFSPAVATNIFLKKNNISKIALFTNQFLKEDFSDFEKDNNEAQAIILGDLYKEFNFDKLNHAFQIINNNKPLIVALHKNRYCKREGKLGLDLGPFVAALEYASSIKSILIGKPEKNFFNLAIEDMKLNNEDVVMIGDDIVADIEGAKNVGLKTIQVKTGKYQKKDETEPYIQPDTRIDSITELFSVLDIK